MKRAPSPKNIFSCFCSAAGVTNHAFWRCCYQQPQVLMPVEITVYRPGAAGAGSCTWGTTSRPPASLGLATECRPPFQHNRRQRRAPHTCHRDARLQRGRASALTTSLIFCACSAGRPGRFDGRGTPATSRRHTATAAVSVRTRARSAARAPSPLGERMPPSCHMPAIPPATAEQPRLRIRRPAVTHPHRAGIRAMHPHRAGICPHAAEAARRCGRKRR